MIAINFTTARGRLKDFCDRVTDRGETVIVTRKAEKNVVIISEERFNELEKATTELAMLNRQVIDLTNECKELWLPK